MPKKRRKPTRGEAHAIIMKHAHENMERGLETIKQIMKDCDRTKLFCETLLACSYQSFLAGDFEYGKKFTLCACEIVRQHLGKAHPASSFSRERKK